jgi:hypothetical protein
MRRILPFCFALIALAGAVPATAEAGFELTPFVGYRFAGEFDVDDPFFDFSRNPEIDDSEVFGGILSFPVNDHFYVELLYSTQDSTLLLERGIFAPEVEIGDATLDYALVGVTWQWNPGQVRPFVGVSAGIAMLDPEGDFGSETRFALDIHGGVKLMFSDHLGLRLEGRVYWADFNELEFDDCCDGDGSFYQVEALGGLVIAF